MDRCFAVVAGGGRRAACVPASAKASRAALAVSASFGSTRRGPTMARREMMEVSTTDTLENQERDRQSAEAMREKREEMRDGRRKRRCVGMQRVITTAGEKK